MRTERQLCVGPLMGSSFFDPRQCNLHSVSVVRIELDHHLLYQLDGTAKVPRFNERLDVG
jgi:hypothetical protein